MRLRRAGQGDTQSFCRKFGGPVAGSTHLSIGSALEPLPASSSSASSCVSAGSSSKPARSLERLRSSALPQLSAKELFEEGDASSSLSRPRARGRCLSHAVLVGLQDAGANPITAEA